MKASRPPNMRDFLLDMSASPASRLRKRSTREVCAEVFHAASASGDDGVCLSSMIELLLGIRSVSSASLFRARGMEEHMEAPELICRFGRDSQPFPSELVNPSIAPSQSNHRRLRGSELRTTQLMKSDLSSGGFEYFVLRSRGQLIGYLELHTTRPMTRSEMSDLRLLSQIIAKQIDTESVVEDLITTQKRLDVLTDLSHIVTLDLPLSELCNTIAKEAAYRFAADSVMLAMQDSSTENLQITGSFGVLHEKVRDPIPFANTLIGTTLRLGGVLSVSELNDTHIRNLPFLEAVSPRSLYIAGVEHKGKPLGVILLTYKNRHILPEKDTILLEEVARATGVALENAKTQAHLNAYAERLENLVAERTEDLRIQTNKAQQASQTKSRFIANMSHELRAPLTSVIGYTSVLSNGLLGEVNERQREALDSISQASEHLTSLINEVLNLARIEAGKEQPEPSSIELDGLLKQMFTIMLQHAVNKGISFQAPQLLDDTRQAALWTDPRHIRQILINLISNAIKYTPEGGSVFVNAELIGDKARISVTDNGVGISESELIQVFDRFERGTNSYSNKQSGAGIGLSLTKHLVEINGGRIGVESTLNKGSTFWVIIPLDQQEADKSADKTKIDKGLSHLEGLSVLIVDDNPATLEAISKSFELAGATTHTAGSVGEAIVCLSKHHIDSALVDLALPGESGVALIAHIRTHHVETSAKQTILAMSSCAIESERQAAIEEGAAVFIPKPFYPNELIPVIRRLTIESALSFKAPLDREEMI